MFENLSTITTRKLWKHQSAALSFAIDHLNRLDSPCLIRMPTGTGKTGIIACLAMLSNKGSTLVLTPWAHLRDQMVADLRAGFWNKLKLAPKPTDVVPMLPSTATDILKSKKPQVIVATFATLNDLRLHDAQTYEKVGRTISLVAVDEGHYEPAVEWGKSVKGLNAKTVLLTATPYRNDLKLFRIVDADKSTHHFTHKQAVDKRIIRNLGFTELVSETDIPSLSAAFAQKWTAAKKAGRLPSRTPRAIICCYDASGVETAVTHLRQAGLKAIGIHEQFETSKDPNLLKNVPDPQATDAEIWVHQHKLTEGLDDHRFCCVGLFSRIRNDRKLIQQIGRILRRNADDRDMPAIIMSPPEFSAEFEWNAYLSFEQDLKLLEPEHFRTVVENLLGSQPEVEYFEGRFRRRFRPANLQKQAQVIISPSVLVRTTSADFTLADYIEDCTDTLNIEDAVILGPDINAPCQKSAAFALWVYASVGNSRLLQNTSLYEVKLETHCVVQVEGYVFMTDTKGIFPEEYLEEHTGRLPAEQLTRYLDDKFRPTQVSLNSSIPYDTVLRASDLHGHNLLSVATSLTDRVQICRSARGNSKDFGRRYVGLNNGRLRKEASEEERRNFEPATFVSWAKSVAKILKSGGVGSALFQRYLPTCAPPPNPIPRTICIDLVRLDLSLTLADGRQCRMKRSSADIKVTVKDNRNTYSCSFELEGDGINGLSISLRLDYHHAKQRFWFNKAGGISVQVNLVEDDRSTNKSLAEFLNQKQDIILIGLDGGEIVYQGRNFYKIDYSYAEQALIGLIKRPKNAPRCRTEKGSKAEIEAVKRSRNTTFPKGSLFGAVANQQIDLPFTDTLLICDDLGTECADFVACNFDPPAMALIHAKAGDGKQISASAFHDVVAQAMKNLVYLTRSAEVPDGVDSWQRTKKWNNTSIPRLYRTPAGLPSGSLLWDKLKSNIISGSNPALYVVLVTAGCCDLKQLEQAIRIPGKRTPEVAQLLHLLDGLNGYARQLGAQLIVRDLPC